MPSRGGLGWGWGCQESEVRNQESEKPLFTRIRRKMERGCLARHFASREGAKPRRNEAPSPSLFSPLPLAGEGLGRGWWGCQESEVRGQESEMRHCERSEAIQRFFLRTFSGLMLRFARNDADKPPFQKGGGRRRRTGVCLRSMRSLRLLFLERGRLARILCSRTALRLST